MPLNKSFFSNLDILDWGVVFAYFLVTILIGVYYRKRASQNIASYFVSGRNLPWWLLGTSMVATTFAADTPLAVTGWIRTEGIWKNWFWWNYIFSHVFIIFVFSRLWRRAEVITDNELIELRYSGKPAAFLRGFKAFYFSTIFNFIVIGWVVAAMSKVLGVFFGIEKIYAVIFCLSVAFLYTMLSGLWGVVVTDFLQYIFAVAGTLILAYVVINSQQIGGFDSFVTKINNIDPEHLKFFITSCESCETTGFFSSSFFTFLIFVTIIWWSSHNADGGGYFIQRFLSAKNEKHAVLGMAWFVLNHYIIRFWPWVLVALASIIVFPSASITGGDEEAVYVAMIRDFLGPGLKGLLLVTFLAAFMSTISTQLNWGSSYLLNDIYRRFMVREASEGHYVAMSRFITFLLTIISGFIAFQISNIGNAWIFVWAMSSGIGLVLILRWFWWRINAWSEITALAVSLISMVLIIIYTRINGLELELKYQIIVVPVSIAAWVIVTFMTRPEPNSKLDQFYKKVRPWGFWHPVSANNPDINTTPFIPIIINWILGVCFVIASLTGIGKLLLGSTNLGLLIISVAAVSGTVLYIRVKNEFSNLY